MSKEKSAEEQRIEKEQRELQNQVTENTFNDRSHIPNEQNRFKGSEPPRSSRS